MADRFNMVPEGDDSLEFQEEERREILARIDELLEKDRAQLRPEPAAFRARHRGLLFPVLINFTALALLLGAAFLLPSYFTRREESLVSRSTVSSSAEGRLFEAVRREAEGKLREKDLELSQIQQQYLALNRERDGLKGDLEQQIRRREAGFQESLVHTLVERRQQLEAEGAARTVVEARLRELEQGLRGEHSNQIEELRRTADAALMEKEAQIAVHLERYSEMVRQVRQERDRVEQALAASLKELEAEAIHRYAALEEENARLVRELSAARETAGVVETAAVEIPAGAVETRQDGAGELFRALLEGYDRVRELAEAGRSSEALEALSALRGRLSGEEVAALPGVGDRLAGELFVIDTLAGTLRGGNTRGAEAAGPGPAELEASRRLAELQAEQARAVRALEGTVGRLQEELGAARRQLEVERALSRRYLAVLETRRSAPRAGAPAGPTRETMLELVQAKVQTREIVGSEPIRSRYPGLYENLNRYFDEFDKISRREGQREALRDVLGLLDELLRQKEGGGSRSTTAVPEGSDPYPYLLRSLEALLK